MRWVPDPTGRFPHRPFYEVEELEARCAAALHGFYAGKLQRPFRPPMTDHELQALVEAHVEDLDLYADLSSEGPDVEALTEFRPQQRPRIRIATQLSRDPRRRKRVRTGLAHELGHVLFHSSLFMALWEQHGHTSPALLQRAVCKRATIITPRHPDWAEWQAGYSCGAVLMPKTYLEAFVQHAWRALAGRGLHPDLARRRLIRRIAAQFDVSTEAARVRLAVLGLP